MKIKYILFSTFFLISTFCFGQKELFDKYAEEDQVTSVYISRSMFQMMLPAVQTAGLKLMNIAGKIESLQVLNTENAGQAEKMRKDFSNIITKEHEELMRIRHDKTRSTFHIKQEGSKISEMVMLADTEDGFTIIRLSGDFTLQDIQDITSEINK